MMDMNVKLKLIIEQISRLTLLEARDLVKQIESVFNVTVSDNAPVLSAQLPINPVEIIEEKVAFDLYLIEVPSDKKIAALKLIRTATGLGLKESKEIADNTPRLVKEGLSKEEADTLKKDFEAIGAKVDLK